MTSDETYKLDNFNLLTVLWSFHGKQDDDNPILHSFESSYDLTNTKKSFESIALMADGSKTKTDEIVSDDVDLKQKFDNTKDNIQNYQMYSPRQLVQKFALNREHGEIKPNKANSWKIQFKKTEKPWKLLNESDLKVLRKAKRQIRENKTISISKPDLEALAQKVGLLVGSQTRRQIVNSFYKINESVLDERILKYDEPIYKKLKNPPDEFTSIRLMYGEGQRKKTYEELPSRLKLVCAPNDSFRNFFRIVKDVQKPEHLFSSLIALNVIPYRENIENMFSVRRIMYYYQSKASELNIESLKERCAEENYDTLYTELINRFLVENGYTRDDFYPQKENLQKEQTFVADWQRQYKEGLGKVNGLEDKFYKRIIKKDMKKQFTDLFKLYLKSHNVPLNEIINYFK